MRNRLMNGATFMAEGGPTGGVTYSAEFVDRLKEERETLRTSVKEMTAAHKEELKALRDEHKAAMAEAKTAHEQAIAALTAEHKTATEKAAAVHAEALTTAKKEGADALAAAESASKKRTVTTVLHAEAKAAGLLDLDQLKLLDPAEVEKLTVDDAGSVAGVKELVAGLKTAKPFLFGTGSTSGGTGPDPNNPKPKKATEMDDKEFDQAMKEKAWRKAA